MKEEDPVRSCWAFSTLCLMASIAATDRPVGGSPEAEIRHKIPYVDEATMQLCVSLV